MAGWVTARSARPSSSAQSSSWRVPAELEDLIQSGFVSLGDVDQVVIDEADRMADMGFLPAVRRILGLTSDERQVLLFSATFDGAVSKLAGDVQRNPVVHEIGAQGPDISATRHIFWRVDRTGRAAATADAIKAMGSTIVFCPDATRCRSAHQAARPARCNGDPDPRRPDSAPSTTGPFERSPMARCAR